MDAIIPAGGSISGAYALRVGTTERCLAPLGCDRKPVLQRVVDSLRESHQINRIVCAAPATAVKEIQNIDLWTTDTGSGPGNILSCLTQVSPNELTVVCTSDLPLIRAADIRGFVEQADPDADIVIGVVTAEQFDAAFPGSPESTYVRLADIGPVTMACLFLVRASVLLRSSDMLTRAFEARKSQIRMAALLGPALVWQFATRSLSLDRILRRAQRLLNCHVQVIKNVAPTLAFDIDSVDDYEYAHATLVESAAI